MRCWPCRDRKPRRRSSPPSPPPTSPRSPTTISPTLGRRSRRHHRAHRLHRRGRVRTAGARAGGRRACSSHRSTPASRTACAGGPRRPRHASPRSQDVPLRQRHRRDHDLIEAGLGWSVSVDGASGDYPGRAVLAAQKKDGPPRKLVGLRGGGPRNRPSRLSCHSQGRVVGRSRREATRHSSRRTSAFATSRRPSPSAGTEIDIDIRGRRVAARVVPTPFYKRPR